MVIKNTGYNVLDCNITTSLTHDVKTEIGTKKDFEKILDVACKAGLVRGEMTLDTVKMKGTMILNPYADLSGIEFFTVSMAGGGTPFVVIGDLTVETNKLYITVKVVSLS